MWKPLYATVDDLKGYTRIPDLDTVDDAEIALALEGSSRAIDDHTHRQFGLVVAPEVRYYTPVFDCTRRRRYVVDIDDLQTITGLVIQLDTVGDGTYSVTVDNATIKKLALNAAAEGLPWEQIVLPEGTSVSAQEGSVRITARWGWTATPDAIKQACLFQANRLLKRRESPLGVAGSPEMGNELRLLAKLDPDVAVLVNTYRKFFWGA